MVELNNINVVYFIGIGGIGMSALARYFHSQGKQVSGYDKTESDLTKELMEEGISVHYDENVSLIPKDAELVVYTPAVPSEHAELVFYQSNEYTVLKRSEVLGMITSGAFNICVAGTHGKTTISTMIAHILRHSGYGCNAFLGGISVNYGSNFWSNKNNVCVVEADEYDRSFLRLSPDVAVITAMDADHLDIYGTEVAMQDAFVEFSGRVKDDGLLLSKYGLHRAKDFKSKHGQTYSLQNDAADIYGAAIRLRHGSYEFDVMMKDFMLDNVQLNIGGMHNVENSIAAIGVANYLGISSDKIKNAIADFMGVKRRFEYIIKRNDLVFVDDYAHHPEELKALITGAKALFADKKCTIVFQPHLYTRTRDLADEFAEVLDLADEAILLPVYPARELPIKGVSSGMIADKMKNDNKKLMSKVEMKDWIKKSRPALLITAGAGDIDREVEELKKILDNI
jgi:UDP-N-acetylmuramate--alanine ligase